MYISSYGLYAYNVDDWKIKINSMIPKIIHYCWFGGNPLPESAKKCIDSWRKFLPEYEIKEWNESNYDVHKIPYIHEAYEARKFAFVSDYARFDILYQYGGVYFDTDVQVIKEMDDIVARGPFMGREASAWMTSFGIPTGLTVAPGLGLGAPAGNNIYKEILDHYEGIHFLDKDGSLMTTTVGEHVTSILIKHGLNDDNEHIVNIEGIWIYPADVFCPMDYTKGNLLTLTERSVSIHLYDCSWLDHDTLSWRIHVLKNKLANLFGSKIISWIANVIKGR